MAGEAGEVRKRRINLSRWRRKRRAQSAMTMMEHLGELRNRLFIAAAAFFAVSIVAFFFFEPILNFLLKPLCSLDPDRLGPQGCKLITHTPLEGFMVRLKVTAMVGIVGASPVWLYQLWAFVIPGLTSKERRYATPFVMTSVVLFALGATGAYLTLPAGLRFLIALGGTELVPFFRAEEYLNFVGLIILGFGATMELPLLLFFLGLAGVLSVETLRRHRKSALVGVVALAAVVTPSQDPYTLFALAIPLYVLYEVTILLLSFIKKRKAKT